MTPSALESALAKLRTQAAAPNWPVPAHITSQEAAALLAKIEAADRLAATVEKYRDALRLYGTGYLTDVKDALAAYRNPQHAGDTP